MELISDFFNLILQIASDWGYGGIFFLMAIESSFIPFPSEIVVPPAAYLAAQGKFNFFLVIGAGVGGSLAGAIVNYWLAKSLGRTIVYSLVEKKWAKIFLLDRSKLEQAEKYFFRYGNSSTFIGRLVPVIRQLISLPAGFVKMDFKKFIWYTFLGSGLWVFILAILGYLLGANEVLFSKYYRLVSLNGILLAVVFVVCLFLKNYKNKINNMDKKSNLTMDTIISLAKRRGFVFPSSEIYGGFAAIYDYGSYGVELANNIKAAWWRNMVQLREDIVGLDSSIFMSPKIWEASGHVSGFSDPLSECKNCHSRLRVDHLLEEIGVTADEKMSEKEIQKLFDKNKSKLKCPNCGQGDFTDIKKFNLLVKSNLGNFTEDWNKEPVYLRGETCQGIYVNYKNVLDSTRVKIPFGIAQIGKAFRNEITARQFVFRTREFEQMEMQYFISPPDEMKEYDKLKKYRWQYYLDLGIREENLQWHQHENLVFYAKEAYDIEYNFPFGFKELEGVHARGDYDLSQHSKYSGKDLSYIDPITKEKYLPHIIESSVGVGRTLLAVMCDAYTEEEVNGETRVVMKFNKKLAPIKIAVFPLLKNKPELVKKAKEIFDSLKVKYMCEFDDNGNIGKRYRRQDEIGTPYCVTVDFETLEKDDSVTVRDRDTMKQERVKVADVEKYFAEKF